MNKPTPSPFPPLPPGSPLRGTDEPAHERGAGDPPCRLRRHAVWLHRCGLADRLLAYSAGQRKPSTSAGALASRDYGTQNQFAFFDLPAGTYTLSIEAEGCEPYSTTQEVRPGEFSPPPPFRLTIR